MSDVNDKIEKDQAGTQTAAAPSPAPSVEAASTNGTLEGVEEIDFLLEEIENKIAPLALA